MELQFSVGKIDTRFPAIEDVLRFGLLHQVDSGFVIDSACFGDLQGFIDDQTLGCRNHVLEELRDIAAAQRSHVDCILCHIEEVWSSALKKSLLPADKERQIS